LFIVQNWFVVFVFTKTFDCRIMALSSDNSLEELISNLRQLFIGISPKIRNASSQEEAEDVFLRLEETDPDFHRFTI
jgi:hypothetical protein